MNRRRMLVVGASVAAGAGLWAPRNICAGSGDSDIRTLNVKDDGYRGIWYMNQPSNDEYVYKYSGGLGTYCAKHRPFAVYRPEVNRTFFCYGGARHDNNRQLLHMVSFYDHATETVPRPTILLDKMTDDAHDNPVISVDGGGFIWIFSTSHGESRPSFIHRSVRPYDIDKFERIHATRGDGGRSVSMDNFSYMQVWHDPRAGFLAFFTKYNWPAKRSLGFMTSHNGIRWSEWQRLAAMEEGHYQVSALGRGVAGTAFNMHPEGKGLNWRTNLYYMETPDYGKTWRCVNGRNVYPPLCDRDSPALVLDYSDNHKNIYLKDIVYDYNDHPIMLVIESPGYESGPVNDPRRWLTVRWTGKTWETREVTTSDNNYDMGSLYPGSLDWRIIAPTETGAQPYNPGGEMAMWITRDAGNTWNISRFLTQNSTMNHTYARRPVNANSGFYSFWADGHGRKPSESNLYFTTLNGEVYLLPREMSTDNAKPERIR